MRTTIVTCTMPESLEILRRCEKQAMHEYKIRVTFTAYETCLDRSFEIVELHRSIDDARLRAAALGWSVSSVETRR